MGPANGLPYGTPAPAACGRMPPRTTGNQKRPQQPRRRTTACGLVAFAVVIHASEARVGLSRALSPRGRVKAYLQRS
jgi:hypothetical protein